MKNESLIIRYVAKHHSDVVQFDDSELYELWKDCMSEKQLTEKFFQEKVNELKNRKLD